MSNMNKIRALQVQASPDEKEKLKFPKLEEVWKIPQEAGAQREYVNRLITAIQRTGEILVSEQQKIQRKAEKMLLS